MKSREIKFKHVTPVEGRRVRDPHSFRVLAEAGEPKVIDSYWIRRAVDGDVVIGDETSITVNEPEPGDEPAETSQQLQTSIAVADPLPQASLPVDTPPQVTTVPVSKRGSKNEVKE